MGFLTSSSPHMRRGISAPRLAGLRDVCAEEHFRGISTCTLLFQVRPGVPVRAPAAPSGAQKPRPAANAAPLFSQPGRSPLFAGQSSQQPGAPPGSPIGSYGGGQNKNAAYVNSLFGNVARPAFSSGQAVSPGLPTLAKPASAPGAAVNQPNRMGFAQPGVRTNPPLFASPAARPAVPAQRPAAPLAQGGSAMMEQLWGVKSPAGNPVIPQLGPRPNGAAPAAAPAAVPGNAPPLRTSAPASFIKEPAPLNAASQGLVDNFTLMRKSFATLKVTAQVGAETAKRERAAMQGQQQQQNGRLGFRGRFQQQPAKASYNSQVTNLRNDQQQKAAKRAADADRLGGRAGAGMAASMLGKNVRSRVGMFRNGPGRNSAAVAAARRAALYGRTVSIVDDMTPKMLAKAMGVKLGRVMAALSELGEESLGVDGLLDGDVAEMIVTDCGQSARREDAKRRDRVRTLPPPSAEAAAKGYPHRAPVVTVMGHVDHGKTTLLDALRGTNVAEREAGGITQGVAAFSVPMRAAAAGTGDRRAPGGKGSKSESAKAVATAKASVGGGASGANAAPAAASHVDVMTFLDTPGHALFSSMRRRGTAVTDVVVLVVDGRDGVMPQTKECVEIILASGCPSVVAVTKCDAVSDAPKAVESIAKQLLALGLAVEGFGGDSPILPISAKSGLGLAELKDAIALTAELLDLRAPCGPGTLGEASIVDARTVKGSGVVVDVIVRWGSLRVGDIVVAGEEFGKVKALQTDAVGAASVNRRLLEGSNSSSKAKGSGSSNSNSKKAKGKDASTSGGDGEAEGGSLGLASVAEALPGTPVRVLGLKGVPPAGEDLLAVEDEERAKAVIEGRARRRQAVEAQKTAAADAVRRAAERKAYTERRQAKLAFEAAQQRERKRNSLLRAGMPLPPELRVQPWETAILSAAAAGRIQGVGSAKRASVQGAQQTDVTMTFAQAEAGAAAAADAGQGADGAAAAAASTGPKHVAFIVKTDTAGALTAVQDALARVPSATHEVLPRVVHTGVGEVTERDVEIAGDFGAHILAFNAKVPPAVQKAAERRKVRLVSGRVIYHLLDEVCELLADYMAHTTAEEVAAVAEVKQVFAVNAKRAGGVGGTPVAGCVILEGTFLRSGMTVYRLMRGDDIVGTAVAVESLLHFKDKVESVKKGSECGMVLAGLADYAPGDRILAVRNKTVKPKLVVRYD